MADDIRIKDLQSTASYMESDDYLPIDGLALGNRKIPFTGLMDSEDDRLPTTDKTPRGAITEHEGDINEIKQSLSNLVKTATVNVTFATNPYATPFTSAATISCQNDLGIDRSRVISVLTHAPFSVLWYFYSNDTDTIILSGSTTQTVSVDVLYI